MLKLIKIFNNLLKQPFIDSKGYNIASIPEVLNHKIGVSEKFLPMFFIKCDDTSKSNSVDINLEYISIYFNRKCVLYQNNRKLATSTYVIISLKNESIDIQEYFLNVVNLVIVNLSGSPKFSDLQFEIDKLISLFSKLTTPPKKTIQGLWAELLVIEHSKNPEYIIQSWHSSKSDKFDFNDGFDKIEVKSTSKSRRIHSFSIEQLNPNLNSSLIIVSIFTVQTGIGKNIFDLIDLIEKRLKNNSSLFRINEIVANTLGKDMEKAFDIYFDYQLAVDSIKLYQSSDIPSIDNNLVLPEISNVRFDCDLTNVMSVKKKQVKSLLHKLLI